MAFHCVRVTVTDHDYHWTVYSVVVTAVSREKAILKAGALIGQAKMRREAEITKHGLDHIGIVDLLEPDITIEKATVDEFYANEGQVQINPGT